MSILDTLFRPRGATTKAPTTVSREPKYVEVDWKGHAGEVREYIKVISLNDFSDVEAILEQLRDRNNILILKVKPNLVQEKLELKRALKRIQRTCSAIGGDIAGIREDMFVITPPDVQIYRGSESASESTDEIAEAA